MLSYTKRKLSMFWITRTPSFQRMYIYYKQNLSAFQPFFMKQQRYTSFFQASKFINTSCLIL